MRPQPSRSDRERYETLGFGFPAVAFACDYLRDPVVWRRNPITGVVIGPNPYAVAPTQSGVSWTRVELQRVLPTRVVWSGVVTNVVVYGVVCWGALLVMAVVRGRRARFRWLIGRCGACGYEVESLDRCPECGTDRPGWARVRESG